MRPERKMVPEEDSISIFKVLINDQNLDFVFEMTQLVTHEESLC